MTIEELKKRKQDLGYSNEKISALSGVPLGTVTKIFGGVTASPRYRTIQALEKALIGAESRLGAYSEPYDSRKSSSGLLRDEASAFAPAPRPAEKRKYTTDDYYAFKDDIRRELIDGRLFVMDAPSVKHQVIIGELYILFRQCADVHGDKCRVILSPCDVQLDRDRYTMVQPDLLVICDNEKIRTRVCFGAPDLAVEIMSPSSRSRDSVLKLNKYMSAGVREFWLVDPENRTVIVYLAGEDGMSSNTFQIYSFNDSIPIGISGGECEVDFKVVSRAVEGLAD